jgi:hypothetical protein
LCHYYTASVETVVQPSAAIALKGHPEMKYPMTDVIALRHLPWRSVGGAPVTIEVRFGLPAPLPESGDGEPVDWYCPYEIERIGEPAGNAGGIRKMLVQHAAFGIDSVQALYLALGIVGVEISTLAGSPGPEWANDPTFGFPALPKK